MPFGHILIVTAAATLLFPAPAHGQHGGGGGGMHGGPGMGIGTGIGRRSGPGTQLDTRPETGFNSNSGYLGVDYSNLSPDRASALHDTDAHGVEITRLDHDAPAAKAGLKLEDVVVSINGTATPDSKTLRKLLSTLPSGQIVNLNIVRDGTPMTLTATMSDKRTIEREAREQMRNSGDTAASGGFHLWGGHSLHVGVMTEPLSPQMAAYLALNVNEDGGGVMVKNVAHRSEAESAGFKPFDVILKLNTEPIRTESDWEHTLRANQGKSVTVTILRDKKPMDLTLPVDSHRP